MAIINFMSNNSLLLKEKSKRRINNYSFNKSLTPYPGLVLDKTKPPVSHNTIFDNSHLFVPKPELSLDEQAQNYMDAYRKAERIVVINFYTGGSAYKKGIIDAIYRGVNSLNPTM